MKKILVAALAIVMMLATVPFAFANEAPSEPADPALTCQACVDAGCTTCVAPCDETCTCEACKQPTGFEAAIYDTINKTIDSFVTALTEYFGEDIAKMIGDALLNILMPIAKDVVAILLVELNL